METSTPLTSSTFLHKGGDSREKLSSAANERNPTENWAHTDTCMSVMSNLGEPNFQVDDLLDLPIEEDELGNPLVPHADVESLLFAQPHAASLIENSQVNFEAETLNEEPSYGLCVPPDELVHQLEWLSAFNEDNFFTGDTKLQSSLPSSLRARSGLAQTVEPPRVAHKARDNFHSRSPISVLEEGSHSNANPWALNHVYKAHRVRKARTGGRVWSLDILKPILLENRLKASYDNTSLLVTSCSSAFSEPLCSFLQQDDSERPYKKMKQVEANYCAVDSVLVRRCTHCLVQKTPQWRAGPLGPKTLCNACGVRYKSGRLVPEYRPAASPSFVNEVHSNSHRRILEMRRAKGVESHVVEDQKKMERVEEAYNTNLKGESCIADDTYEESLCMHASIEMLSSTESSSCEELVVSKEAEVSGEDDSSGEGPNGKEGPIDGGIGLCNADIISYDHHLHEKGKTGKDTHV